MLASGERSRAPPMQLALGAKPKAKRRLAADVWPHDLAGSVLRKYHLGALGMMRWCSYRGEGWYR